MANNINDSKRQVQFGEGVVPVQGQGIPKSPSNPVKGVANQLAPSVIAQLVNSESELNLPSDQRGLINGQGAPCPPKEDTVSKAIESATLANEERGQTQKALVSQLQARGKTIEVKKPDPKIEQSRAAFASKVEAAAVRAPAEQRKKTLTKTFTSHVRSSSVKEKVETAIDKTVEQQFEKAQKVKQRMAPLAKWQSDHSHELKTMVFKDDGRLDGARSGYLSGPLSDALEAFCDDHETDLAETITRQLAYSKGSLADQCGSSEESSNNSNEDNSDLFGIPGDQLMWLKGQELVRLDRGKLVRWAIDSFIFEKTGADQVEFDKIFPGKEQTRSWKPMISSQLDDKSTRALNKETYSKIKSNLKQLKKMERRLENISDPAKRETAQTEIRVLSNKSVALFDLLVDPKNQLSKADRTNLAKWRKELSELGTLGAVHKQSRVKLGG